MAFKIYTKTGDKGETGIFGGKRLPKDDIRIEAYGTVDELNAHLGLVRDQATDTTIRETLKAIQDRLFAIGAYLASDPAKELPPPDIQETDISFLENEMDRMDKSLTALRNFILPGGHPIVSQTHITRCVCRRAERRVVTLANAELVNDIVIRYLNRLSDYCFILGRYQAKTLNAQEVVWKPRT